MSNKQSPEYDVVCPHHIAIVMDGNGRWAQENGQPRLVGHAAGVKALRRCVEACVEIGVRYLTVFAFSSENWRRPADEVQGIMALFVNAVQTELADLHQNGVKLQFIGDRAGLSAEVVAAMEQAEQLEMIQPKMTLIVAMNYGGRWDIIQAAKQLIHSGQPFSEEALSQYLTTTQFAPEPDLIIRTGGELRISNFLLWQAAYAEFYFTERLWPDFAKADLLDAIEDYRQRERRFGALSLE